MSRTAETFAHNRKKHVSLTRGFNSLLHRIKRTNQWGHS